MAGILWHNGIALNHDEQGSSHRTARSRPPSYVQVARANCRRHRQGDTTLHMLYMTV